MTLFHGLVLFTLDPVGGWRIFDHCEIGHEIRPLPLHQISVSHTGNLLGVCGTFRRRPRVGIWCKRPHKELAHA